MANTDPRNKPAPGATGGAQAPPQSTTPPVRHRVVNYFESFNKQNEQRQRQLLGMPSAVQAPQIDTPTAGQGYQQAFPRPKDTLQQNANNAAPVPQIEQPKKQYLFERAEAPVYAQTPKKEINPDDYRDGTSDGLGRNFLSKTFVPKTEEDYSRENETTKRVLALGNALRHIGNIVNTSKGGPVQTFNDPVALAEQQYQTKRAQRIADEQRKENAAYKQAQMDYQKGKLEGDRDYKNFLLQLKLGQAKTAEERNKVLDAFRKEQQDWREKNAAEQLAYRKKKDEEDREFRRRVHADNLANQAANRALRQEIHNSSSSVGGGKGRYYGTVAGKSYTTKADYDKAVVAKAKEYGIPLQYKKNHYDMSGEADGSYDTNRTIPGLASEVEKEYQKRAKMTKSYGFTEVGREPQRTTAAARGGARNPGAKRGAKAVNRHEGVNSAFGK